MSKKRKKTTPDRKSAAAGWGRAGAAARTVIGLVFLVSGPQKVMKPAEEFAVVIEAYHIVSAKLALAMAQIIPPVEMLLALALIGGFAPRPAAAATGGFLLLFIGALGSTLLRGIPLESCGCFGSIHLTPLEAITLDMTLLCLAYLAYRHGGALAPIESWIQKGKEDSGHA